MSRMTVSRCVSVMRSVDRIELPSTRAPMICVRRARERRFIVGFPNSMLYALSYYEAAALSIGVHTWTSREPQIDYSRPLVIET